jgi:uncharacterized protein YcbK (DUF882 family)
MKIPKSQSYMPLLNRRRFLVASTQAVFGLLLSPSLTCWASTSKKHLLTFFHTHTEEYLEIPYTPGTCLASVQQKIKIFLRDFRTGDLHSIDPTILDILCKIQSATGSQGTIEVISGYRSPKTNNFLSHLSSGVAANSLHMKGRAVDIRITDLPTVQLRNTAVALRTGGVGYYSESDFVHLDTGPYRTW